MGSFVWLSAFWGRPCIMEFETRDTWKIIWNLRPPWIVHRWIKRRLTQWTVLTRWSEFSASCSHCDALGRTVWPGSFCVSSCPHLSVMGVCNYIQRLDQLVPMLLEVWVCLAGYKSVFASFYLFNTVLPHEL